MHKILPHAIYFGSSNTQCAVLAENVAENDGILSFDVRLPDCSGTVKLPLEGQHYVADAMASIAVGLCFGVSQETMAKSLAKFRNMEGRQEIFQTGAYTIIQDCYNAGPESMAAALAVLGNKTGRKIAVLGDMLELGDNAPAEHYRLGRIVAEKADMLFAYGPNSGRVLSGAITGGMSDICARAFDDRDKLVDALKLQVKPGDVLLFKGSHGMKMDLALQKFLHEEK